MLTAKIRKLCKIGKGFSVFIAVLSYLLFIVAAAAVVAVFVLPTQGIEVKTYTDKVMEFLDNIGFHQEYRVMLGIIIAIAIIFLGEAIMSTVSASYCSKVIKTFLPSNAKCVKLLKKLSINCLIIPALSIGLCFAGMYIANAIWGGFILDFPGDYSSPIIFSVLFSYVAWHMAFGIAGLILAMVSEFAYVVGQESMEIDVANNDAVAYASEPVVGAAATASATTETVQPQADGLGGLDGFDGLDYLDAQILGGGDEGNE